MDTDFHNFSRARLIRAKISHFEGEYSGKEKALSENFPDLLTVCFNEQLLENLPRIEEVGRKQLGELAETLWS